MFSSGSIANLETLELNGKKWLIGMSAFPDDDVIRLFGSFRNKGTHLMGSR